MTAASATATRPGGATAARHRHTADATTATVTPTGGATRGSTAAQTATSDAGSVGSGATDTVTQLPADREQEQQTSADSTVAITATPLEPKTPVTAGINGHAINN